MFPLILPAIEAFVGLIINKQKTKISAENEKIKKITSDDYCNTKTEINHMASGNGKFVRIISIVLFTMPLWSILGGHRFFYYVNQSYKQVPDGLFITIQIILIGRSIGIQGEDVLMTIGNMFKTIFMGKNE